MSDTTKQIQLSRERHRAWMEQELRYMTADHIRYEVLQQWLHDVAALIYDMGRREGEESDT